MSSNFLPLHTKKHHDLGEKNIFFVKKKRKNANLNNVYNKMFLLWDLVFNNVCLQCHVLNFILYLHCRHQKARDYN